MLQCDAYRKTIEQSYAGIPDSTKLYGKTILLTGATGLIGSAVADMLLWMNERGAGIRLIIAGRSESKVIERFGKREYCFVPFDACANSELSLDESVDYVIHAASNASPELYVSQPIETFLANLNGTKVLLDLLLGKKQEGKKPRFLYVSSSEVYGSFAEDDGKPHREDRYGSVDFLSPRGSYPMGKRSAEFLIHAYIAEQGLDAVVIRPGHIYGPTASKKDKRVSSAWAYDSANGVDILMKSTGEQRRSYVYCTDCAAAILTALIKGECGEAYNIANPDTIATIYEMACEFANAAGTKVSRTEPTEEERRQFNPMNNSALDGRKLCDLGLKYAYSMADGAAETIRVIRAL